MPQNMSLRAKLIANFGVVSLFLLAMGIYSFYSLNDVTDEYDHISGTNLPAALTLADLRANSMAAVRNVTFLSLPGISDADIKEYEGKLKKRVDAFAEAQKKYEMATFAPGEEALFRDSIAKWKHTIDLGEKITGLARSADAKDRAEMNRILRTDFDDAMDAFTTSIRSLMDLQKLEAAKWQQAAHESARTGKQSMAIIAFLGFVVALAFGWVVSKKLSTTLQELSHQLDEGATEVGAASQQLSSSSEELSASTSEQAASLQQTTTSIEQINAMINKNTDNANRSREVSGQSKATAEEGKLIIEELARATQAIADSNQRIMTQVEDGNREISEITKVIAEISNKTKVINDIVFQTKLLSFNASVEAARAGENGKGFAVVAEEVGNLAQMSGNAAKEISTLLEVSTEKVQRIVKDTSGKVGVLITEGKEKVEEGTRIAQRCDAVFQGIVRNVTQVDGLIAEITIASQEQSQGVGEINKAMVQLDQATQQNATVSQQAASASSELAQQAETLRNSVIHLNTLIEGSTSEKAITKASLAGRVRSKLDAKAGLKTPSKNDHRFEEDLAS
jgi:methyl-accepting chemotaxis protein